MSLGGHWSGFGDSPWCLGALKESSGEYLGELLGALWGILGGSEGAKGDLFFK